MVGHLINEDDERALVTPGSTTDKIEEIARAMYDATHAGLSNCYSWDDEWEPHQEPHRGRYLKEARAAYEVMASSDGEVGALKCECERLLAELNDTELARSELEAVCRELSAALTQSSGEIE